MNTLERVIQQPTTAPQTPRTSTSTPSPVSANERRYEPEQAADILTRLEMHKEAERRKAIYKQAEEDLRHVTKEEEDDRIPQSRLYKILEERGFDHVAIDDIITKYYPSVQEQREFFDRVDAVPTKELFVHEAMNAYRHALLTKLQETYPEKKFDSSLDDYSSRHYQNAMLTVFEQLPPTELPQPKGVFAKLFAKWRPQPLPQGVLLPVARVNCNDITTYSGAIAGDVNIELAGPQSIVFEDDLAELKRKAYHIANTPRGSFTHLRVHIKRTYTPGK